MYYNKYITEDMTYEEMEAINDELVSKVTLYVPDEYKIDTERFHENLESYINQIENESKTR